MLELGFSPAELHQNQASPGDSSGSPHSAVHVIPHSVCCSGGERGARLARMLENPPRLTPSLSIVPEQL